MRSRVTESMPRAFKIIHLLEEKVKTILSHIFFFKIKKNKTKKKQGGESRGPTGR